MHTVNDQRVPRAAEVADVVAWLTRAFPGSSLALQRDDRRGAVRFQVMRHGGHYFLAVTDDALAHHTASEIEAALAAGGAAAQMVNRAGQTILLDPSLGLEVVDG